MARPAFREAFLLRQVDLPEWEKVFIDLQPSVDDRAGKGWSPGMGAILSIGDVFKVRATQAGAKYPLAQKFLERSKELADAAYSADAFAEPAARELYPSNRAKLYRCKAFTDAIIEDRPLDKVLCIKAAEDYADHARFVPKGEWDVEEKDYYLSAIELLLLVDAFDEAQRMIDNAPSLAGRYAAERFKFVKSLLKNRGPRVQDAKLQEEFVQFFDTVRDPKAMEKLPKIYPIEPLTLMTLAAMWQKFFLSDDGSYNWDECFRLCCE